MRRNSVVLSIALVLILIMSNCTPEKPEETIETKTSMDLPRSSPESQGISSDGISRLLDSIKSSGTQIHSLMIVRHGQVVAEGWWSPYEPDLKHQLYSLSKSFTSTAVGFAVQEGLFSLEDTVMNFFPEYAPEEVSENLSKLTARHLITMSTGHVGNTMNMLRDAEGVPWPKAFLSLPIEKEPGSTFLYNTAATFMLSAIIQKVTGQTVEEFLKPRLLEPLGITDTDWMNSPEGINTGGYGFRVKTEDIAKLGLLYLQKGKWNGVQLLSEEWVAAATSKQVASSAGDGDFNGDNDWSQGYGYQFWRNRPDGFRADGAYGQFSIVLPKYDVVVAITSQSVSMQATMNLIWDHLIPELKDEALAENQESNNALKEKMSGLEIIPPYLNVVSPAVSQISGKTFELDENEFNAKSVSFDFSGNQCVFTLTEEGKEDISVTSGINYWIVEDNKKPVAKSLFPVPGRLDFDSKIAGSVTWQDEKTMLLTWQFIETCHGDQLICTFEGDTIRISFKNSVAAGREEEDPRKEITGKIK